MPVGRVSGPPRNHDQAAHAAGRVTRRRRQPPARWRITARRRPESGRVRNRSARLIRPTRIAPPAGCLAAPEFAVMLCSFPSFSSELWASEGKRSPKDAGCCEHPCVLARIANCSVKTLNSMHFRDSAQFAYRIFIRRWRRTPGRTASHAPLPARRVPTHGRRESLRMVGPKREGASLLPCTARTYALPLHHPSRLPPLDPVG